MLGWLVVFGAACIVYYVSKHLILKRLSIGTKVERLKDIRKDVRSSLSSEEQEIASKKKALKEARKEV